MYLISSGNSCKFNKLDEASKILLKVLFAFRMSFTISNVLSSLF